MRFVSARDVTMDTAWDALDVAEIDGATVRLHWTDAPYVWHVNDGPRSSSCSTASSTCTTGAPAG